MSSIWIAMILAGFMTFMTRFSFIAISGRWSPSARFRRGLQFVPVAVLTAIITPEVVALGGQPDSGLLNPRFIAALVAAVIAWQTRNTILTIAVGMLLFSFLNFVLH